MNLYNCLFWLILTVTNVYVTKILPAIIITVININNILILSEVIFVIDAICICLVLLIRPILWPFQLFSAVFLFCLFSVIVSKLALALHLS